MNKRLIITAKKYLDELEDGTFLDCYNDTISKDISIAITTRISECNNYFIVVKDERNKDKNSQ